MNKIILICAILGCAYGTTVMDWVQEYQSTWMSDYFNMDAKVSGECAY